MNHQYRSERAPESTGSRSSSATYDTINHWLLVKKILENTKDQKCETFKHVVNVSESQMGLFGRTTSQI